MKKSPYLGLAGVRVTVNDLEWYLGINRWGRLSGLGLVRFIRE